MWILIISGLSIGLITNLVVLPQVGKNNFPQLPHSTLNIAAFILHLHRISCRRQPRALARVRSASMARVPYLEAKDLAPQNQDLLARNLNLYRALVNSPDTARSFMALGMHIRFHMKLDARLRELAILQVGYGTRAPYEYAHHIELGKQFGRHLHRFLTFRKAPHIHRPHLACKIRLRKFMRPPEPARTDIRAVIIQAEQAVCFEEIEFR